MMSNGPGSRPQLAPVTTSPTGGSPSTHGIGQSTLHSGVRSNRTQEEIRYEHTRASARRGAPE